MLQRVQKIISNAGLCSRRKAEELIEKGRVMVNNKKITIGDKADLDKDNIFVNGEKLNFDKKKYIAFYKPKFVLTTLYDPGQKPIILKYLLGVGKRIFPVGRLDYNSEGLLLLTNDGDFSNLVMHPRYEVLKVYHVTLERRVKPGDLEPLNTKIKLKDGYAKVDGFKILEKNLIEVRIHEGRNKIVKRIFKKLGFYVKRLKRVQIGIVKLDNLKPGKWRHLTKKEIDWVFKNK
tara:strand:+ start:133 stop:831 length:699 start_codon:yes stop_codon:yes gene_type:complete